jgi:hypothetical protein
MQIIQPSIGARGIKRPALGNVCSEPKAVAKGLHPRAGPSNSGL